MRRLPILFGFVIVALLTLLRVADPFPVQVLREIGFDFYQRLHPRPAGDLPVRVVDIDEASLGAFGQWPWPRDRLATLANRLSELGAAAIGFDVLFPEPDRMSPSRIAAELPGVDPHGLADHDATFAAALARSPSILGFSRAPNGPPMSGVPKGGIAISGPDPSTALPYLTGVAAPLPLLRDAARGLAAVSLNTELATATVRRLPMLWTDGAQIFPTLSLEALRVAFGLEGIVMLGDTAGPGYMDSVRIGELTVPTTSEGDLWLYYSRPRPDLVIAAKNLLSPGYPRFREQVEGQIVLVGTSASGLLDLHNTTLGSNVPGVEIHAQAIEQMLSGTYLVRPDWVKGLEWLEFLLVGGLLVLVVLQLGPLAGLVTGVAALAIAGGFSWWMFVTQGVMLDASFPLVGLTLTYLALVVVRFFTTDRARKQIRRAFGHYVAPSLLSAIEKNGERLRLGGETRQVTVLFCDMRGFTSLSEQLEPQRMLTILNTLFGALGAEIVGQLGTIDKFIGDSIMAFWNAPLDVAEHQRRALQAALGMRVKLRELNAADAFGLEGGSGPVQRIAIGIGISSGEALVGNMGLETRFDYSAVGDTVNIASRVEGACKEIGYDIVVSRSVREAVPDFAFLDAGAVVLRGKAERVPIHIVVGDAEMAGSASFKLLRATHAEALAALRAGRDTRGALAECMALAAQVEPGLTRFYELVGRRRADFGEVPEPMSAIAG